MPTEQTTRWSPDTCECVWEYTWMRYRCSDCSTYFVPSGTADPVGYCNYHNRDQDERNNCEFNSDEPNRVHTFKRAVEKCDKHGGLSDEDSFNHGKSDNWNKNTTIEEFLEMINEPQWENLKEQYLDTTTYSEGWYFTGTDDSRVIHFVTKGLNQGQRNSLQSRANNRVGVGKVVIE